MKFPMRFRRVVLCLMVGGAIAGSAVAHAETVHARYGVTLIGLPFGTAAFTGSLEQAAYRLELTARLTGIASILSSSQGAATATGSMPNNHVVPATYATTSANGSVTRTVRMAMSNGAVEKAEITPPWGPMPDRIPVSEADMRGVVDPMSALILTVPGTGDVIGPAACNRTIPIFDGATRFDIALTYVGTRKAKTKGYEGPVAVCAARYVPISGHRPNRPGTKFMADNKEIEAWVAPVGQTRMVAPIHISVMTMIGTVVIEATEFSVASANRTTAQTR